MRGGWRRRRKRSSVSGRLGTRFAQDYRPLPALVGQNPEMVGRWLQPRSPKIEVALPRESLIRWADALESQSARTSRP